MNGLLSTISKFAWEARWLWVTHMLIWVAFALVVVHLPDPSKYLGILVVGLLGGHYSMLTTPKYEVEKRY